jgi:hypothetical protein
MLKPKDLESAAFDREAAQTLQTQMRGAVTGGGMEIWKSGGRDFRR